MIQFFKNLLRGTSNKDLYVKGVNGEDVRISAGGVIVRPDGKMVVVRQHANSWALPKGGVERGESLLEGAKREIYEETGITDLACIQELGTYERYSIAKGGVGETREFPVGRRTFFLFHTNQTELAPTDSEVTEARWVTPEEAIALMTHPKDKEFLGSVKGSIR